MNASCSSLCILVVRTIGTFLASSEHGRVYGQNKIALLDDKLHVTPGLKYIYAHARNHDAHREARPDEARSGSRAVLQCGEKCDDQKYRPVAPR